MATATFKPNLANGTITLTFVFDGTQYKGHNITALRVYIPMVELSRLMKI